MSTFSVSDSAFISHINGLIAELTTLQRLVRFLAKDGATYYGDAILPKGVTDLAKIQQARVIKGDIFGKHIVTDQVAVSDPTRPHITSMADC